jgi:hypothetical protein
VFSATRRWQIISWQTTAANLPSLHKKKANEDRTDETMGYENNTSLA